MPRFLKEIITITTLVVLGCSYSLITGIAPLPWSIPPVLEGEILPEDAQTISAIWIDARTLEEYTQNHIPNAILLNDALWDDGIPVLMGVWLETAQPIIVYCSSEGCGASRQIADRLRQALPAAEIYTLKGGFDAWPQ